jgi:hypothetical protein
MSAEPGTYSDRRENAHDKNPYHADIDARVDVGTTTYGIGRALDHNSAVHSTAQGLPGG